MAGAKQGLIVAHGRTVCAGGKCHGPGSSPELSENEAKHLLAAGFLVRSDAVTDPPPAGPAIRQDRGPKIIRAVSP